MSTSNMADAVQYLTFRLQDETYAVDVANIREILDFTNITKVPRTPDFMRGVFNLRGSVVPVIDLKQRFGMSFTEKTANTCIIVMELHIGGETVVIGSLADAVQEVLELEPDRIEPPPRIGTGIDAAFIRGIGKHSDRFLIILDIDRIFSFDDMSVLRLEDEAGSGKNE